MSMERLARSCVVCFTLGSVPALAQAPFLSYDFEDGSIDDFYTPTGINLCGQALPSGAVTVDNGEMLITNDGTVGLTALALHPDVVASSFPPNARNYTVRVRFKLETVNEIIFYLRGRIGIDEGAGTIDSNLERGYAFAIFPQFVDPDPAFADGVLGLAEFTACHEVVKHSEWPGANSDGFGRIAPGFPITPDEWFWIEMTAQGDDDGGPVVLQAKMWLDGDDPPSQVLFTVTDSNGLPHTPETLSDDANVQVTMGTSFDAGQQPGGTARVDDLTITALQGCEQAPLKATREMWEPKTVVEDLNASLFEVGTSYPVKVHLTDLRTVGLCNAPTQVRIKETVPLDWTVASASDGGTIAGSTVEWVINAVAPLPVLTYQVTPTQPARGTFTGEVIEAGSTVTFVVEGDSIAVSGAAVAAISDFGSIQHWLILGSFTRQVGGANPGEAEIVRDYLTDGTVTEAGVQPEAGDTIEPDYDGDAASTGLSPNALGRNPGDVPTWIEWHDLDDEDDRIDFETVYGDLDEVMCYAVTYLNVSEDIVVNFGVSSDDAVHILLDGVELHKNNVARGALGRSYQDTPLNFPNLGNVSLTTGQHTLLVKVFEGGGEHDFRVGFVDEIGLEIPGGPPEVTVSLVPDTTPPGPVFHRGDSNNDGTHNISDSVNTLNVLFLGTGAIPCQDAADSNDDGQVNISDPVNSLNVLFLGTGNVPPPLPPEAGQPCAVDPTAEAPVLGCATYTHC